VNAAKLTVAADVPGQYRPVTSGCFNALQLRCLGFRVPAGVEEERELSGAMIASPRRASDRRRVCILSDAQFVMT
jgi:hypothetical protein